MPPFMADVVWQVAHAGEEEDDGMVAWDPASSLLAVADGRRLFVLDAHAPHERAELRMPAAAAAGGDDDQDDNEQSTTTNTIVALEWSPVGTPRTLLVATRGGMVAVWSQQQRRRRGGGLGRAAPPPPPNQPPAPLLGMGGGPAAPTLPRDSSLGPPPSPPLAALLNAAAPSPPAAGAGARAAMVAAMSPPTQQPQQQQQQQQHPPPLLAANAASRVTPPSERGPPPPIAAAHPTLALDGGAWACTVVVPSGRGGDHEGDGGSTAKPRRRRRLLVHASWLAPQARFAPLDAAAFARLASPAGEALMTRDQVLCRAAAPATANDNNTNKPPPALPRPLPWVREGTLALALLEEEQEVSDGAAGQPASSLARLTLRVCKAQTAPGSLPAWRCGRRAVLCERPATSGSSSTFVAAARYWDGGAAPIASLDASGRPMFPTLTPTSTGCVLVAVGGRDAAAATTTVQFYATVPGDPSFLSSSLSTDSPWPRPVGDSGILPLGGGTSVGAAGAGGTSNLVALAWDPHAACSPSYDARVAYLLCEPNNNVRAGVLVVSGLRDLSQGMQAVSIAAATADTSSAAVIPLPPASGALGAPAFGLAWSPASRAQLLATVSLGGLALAVFDVVAGDDGGKGAAAAPPRLVPSHMGGAAKGRGSRPPPPAVQAAFSPNAACVAACSRGTVMVWPTPAAVGWARSLGAEGGGGKGAAASAARAELAAALAWPLLATAGGGGSGPFWDVAQLAAFVAKKSGSTCPVWEALGRVGGLLLLTEGGGRGQQPGALPSPSTALALDRLKLAVAEALMVVEGAMRKDPEHATALRVAAEARLRLMLEASAQPLLAALEPRVREARAHARAVVASATAAAANGGDGANAPAPPKIEASWLGLDDPLDAAAVRAWSSRLRGLLLLMLACAKTALGRAGAGWGQASGDGNDVDVPFVRLLPDLELARTVQRFARALVVGVESLEGGGAGVVVPAAAAPTGAAADPLAALEAAAPGLGGSGASADLSLAAVAAAFAAMVEDLSPGSGSAIAGGVEDEDEDEEDDGRGGAAAATATVVPLDAMASPSARAAQQHYARAAKNCRLAECFFKAPKADATDKRLRAAVGPALWDRLPRDLSNGQIGAAIERLLGVVERGGGGGGAASAGYGRELALRAAFRAAFAEADAEEDEDGEDDVMEERTSSRQRQRERLWRRAVVARAMGQADAAAAAAQCSVDAVSGGVLVGGGGGGIGIGGAPPMLISCDGGSATRALNAAVLSSASGGRLSGAQARSWAHASPLSGVMWRRAE